MGFRKEEHQIQMPAVVRWVLREGQSDNLTPKSWYPGIAPRGGSEKNPFKGWGLFRAVEFSQVRLILETKWTKVSPAEVYATINELVHQGFLSRLKKDVWSVKRDPVVPSKSDSYYIGTWHRPEHKVKPGVCPRCGAKVQNTNRHKNVLHTGEQCQLNRIRQIMET